MSAVISTRSSSRNSFTHEVDHTRTRLLCLPVCVLSFPSKNACSSHEIRFADKTQKSSENTNITGVSGMGYVSLKMAMNMQMY